MTKFCICRRSFGDQIEDIAAFDTPAALVIYWHDSEFSEDDGYFADVRQAPAGGPVVLAELDPDTFDIAAAIEVVLETPNGQG